MRSCFKALLISLLNLLAVSPVLGNQPTQTEPEAEANQVEVMLGLGLITADDSLYLDGDPDITAIPVVRIKKGRYFFKDRDLGVWLHEDEVLAYSAALSFELSEDRDNSDSLADMDELDAVINLKLTAVWSLAEAKVKLSFAQDISDAHDGNVLDVGVSYPLSAYPLMVDLRVGLSRQSRAVSDYYYGVDPGEDVGRPLYQSDASWAAGLGLGLRYPLDRQWLFSAGLGVKWHDSQVSDSPIVDESRKLVLFVGLVRRF